MCDNNRTTHICVNADQLLQQLSDYRSMSQPQPNPEPRNGGLGALSVLPDELLCYLLHSLDVRELLDLSQASKLLRLLVCEEPLWLQKHLDRCVRPFEYRVRVWRAWIARGGATMSGGPNHAITRGCCRCPLPPLPKPPKPANCNWFESLHPNYVSQLPVLQGSWRATYLAYHPAAGRPALTAAELPPPAPVPGFSSLVLYRQAPAVFVTQAADLLGIIASVVLKIISLVACLKRLPQLLLRLAASPAAGAGTAAT